MKLESEKLKQCIIDHINSTRTHSDSALELLKEGEKFGLRSVLYMISEMERGEEDA